jgi:hypothetical protein
LYQSAICTNELLELTTPSGIVTVVAFICFVFVLLFC